MSCSRCGNPICPECMRDAAVGFHCPSCVAAGAQSTREPRTTFGGRVRPDATRVTLTLIAVNVAVHVLALILGPDDVRLDFGALPGPLRAGDGELVGIAAGEYYRLLTSAFLHANLLHLLFNMMVLATLGPGLEQLLGRARFLALYLLSAVGGSVLGFLLAPVNTLSVGASGAIFGLFGATWVVQKRLRQESTVVGLLVVNLVITFLLPFIDWRAHLGGLAVGTAVAALLAFAPRRQRALVQLAGCAAVGVLLVALVLARDAVLTPW